MVIYYMANDIGEIYEMDSRKNYEVIGKYKGVASSITDLKITSKTLCASSLDGYVRTYDRTDRSLIKKHYMNKPIHSLSVYEI